MLSFHRITFKLFIAIFFVVISAQSSRPQVPRLKYIGIDAGVNFISGQMTDMSFIRSEVPSMYDPYSRSSVSSRTNRYYTGVKYEVLSLTDRMGFLVGFRYSHISSVIGKSDYWSDHDNYFYWLYQNQGTNTDYLKVESIDQQDDYLGVPLEMRYYVAKRPHKFHVFAKLGADFNWLLNSKTSIGFNNKAMNIHESELLEMLHDPKPFYTAMYFGGGIKIGGDNKPSVSLEATMPYLFLTNKSLGITDPSFGGGFQVNFQIPLKF